jgi:putative two-component system response regulator
MRNIKENAEWEKIPVIFLTADKDTATEVECLKMGAVDFIGKPFEPEIMRNRIRRTLEIEEYRKDLEGAVRRQTAKIEKIQHELIISLANLIESRDGSTGEHVKRTSQYVELIVNELYARHMFPEVINEDYIRNLVKAAPMHDIGKISVPDKILQKPGKLTEEEFEAMKSHAAEGGKIIRTTMGEIEEKAYIDIAADVASYHHEKWNGKGYPEGLSGEAIPLSARIMAVADVFDALISKRCYKEPMPLEQAFGIIEESAGEHFDPKIAQVFLELRPQIEEYLSA